MNLKIRFQNPTFVVQVILAVIMPIFSYTGITMEDLNSWSALGDVLLHAVKSPYVLSLVVVSVWNALNDPTTKGVMDSLDVMRLNKCRQGRGDC